MVCQMMHSQHPPYKLQCIYTSRAALYRCLEALHGSISGMCTACKNWFQGSFSFNTLSKLWTDVHNPMSALDQPILSLSSCGQNYSYESSIGISLRIKWPADPSSVLEMEYVWNDGFGRYIQCLPLGEWVLVILMCKTYIWVLTRETMVIKLLVPSSIQAWSLSNISPVHRNLL